MQSRCQLFLRIACVYSIFALSPAIAAAQSKVSSPISSAWLPVLVALIGLFGVVITTTVALLGVALKNAFDRRTEARLQAENERTALLALDAERRLRLDTAVRAIQLLSTATGASAPPIQRAGALFTLCSLAQYDLTISLLDSLLAARDIEPPAAARLLDDIIRHGEVAHQESAASLLITYTDRFLYESGSYELPETLLEGSVSCGEYLRSWHAKIVGNLLVARPLAQWQAARTTVVPLVVALALHWRAVDTTWIKDDAGAILAAVLQVFYPNGGMLYIGAQTVDATELLQLLQNAAPHTAAGWQLVDAIQRWQQRTGD